MYTTIQDFINGVMTPMDDDLIWKKAAINQAIFVRDDVYRIFAVGKDGDARYEWRKANPLKVASTHTSKSTTLPVYLIENDDVKIYMRGNYFNWMVSVECKKGPVSLPDYKLFTRNQVVAPVYCEGFEREWVYESYMSNPSKFTVELPYAEYVLWMFLYLLNLYMKAND